MKRAEVQKAIEEQAFIEEMVAAYKNLLVSGLAAELSNRGEIAERFSHVLAINIVALEIASNVIAEQSGLED